MTPDTLPPLPVEQHHDALHLYFDEATLRAYAAEAVRAEREACANIVKDALDDTWSGTESFYAIEAIWASIRARKDTK